jgi:hypothetical protein
MECSGLIVASALRIVLVSVLGTAAILKLTAPGARRGPLEALIKPSISHPAARLVGVGELCLGAWLTSGIAGGVALSMTAGLFASFSLVLALALRRGFEGSCGCFGALDQVRLNTVHVGRAAALAVVAVITLQLGAACMEPLWSVPASSFAYAALLVGVGTVVFMLATEAADVLSRGSRDPYQAHAQER